MEKKIKEKEEIELKIRDLEVEIACLEREIANLKVSQNEIEKIKSERLNASTLRRFAWAIGTAVLVVATVGLYMFVDGAMEFDVSTRKSCDESLRRINDEIRQRNEGILQLQHQVTDLQRKLKQLQ